MQRMNQNFTAASKSEHLPRQPSLAWLSRRPMALKLRKNSKQPRVLPDFDPAGLVLVEPLALHINPLILLKNPVLIKADYDYLATKLDRSYSVIYAHRETVHKPTGVSSRMTFFRRTSCKNVFITLQRRVCRVLYLFIRLNLKNMFFC